MAPLQVLCNTGNLADFPLGLPNVTQDISITNQRITTVPKYVSQAAGHRNPSEEDSKVTSPTSGTS